MRTPIMRPIVILRNIHSFSVHSMMFTMIIMIIMLITDYAYNYAWYDPADYDYYCAHYYAYYAYDA